MDPDPGGPKTCGSGSGLDPDPQHWFFMYCIKHCLACRPSGVGRCWDLKKRTVVTLALAVRCSYHSARSRPLCLFLLSFSKFILVLDLYFYFFSCSFHFSHLAYSFLVFTAGIVWFSSYSPPNSTWFY